MPGTHFEKLLDERLVLVAHPEIADTLRAPDALRTVTLLVRALRPEAWAYWFSAQGLERDPKQTVLSFSLFSMVVEAAVDKLGVALVPELLVEES